MVAAPEESSKLELDALKTLHDGHIQYLRASSERQFRTVLQTLTLNVAVVAGLIAGKVILSEPGKWFGSILLLVFNVVVVLYLLRQASVYDREREQFKTVRRALLNKCPSIKPEDHDKEQCICCPLWSGSGLFCVAVVIAAVCSIAALWVPLVASSSQSSPAANPALQGTPASGRP